MGIKKSNFSALTTIDDTATLDFVINGQNFKITKANFLAALGVTGTLSQEGDVTGTPVLTGSGTDYLIRNIEASVGVSSAVSVENGVSIKTALLPASSGVQTLFNETTAPQFRGIVAGSGINVAQAGDTIQIALSAVGASSKTVIVTEISDFPPALSGVITLEPDTDYFINADISTSDRFIMQGSTVLRGPDILIGKMTYTGTGDFITVVDATAKITALQLTFMSANMGLNVSATAGNEGTFSMILDRVVMIGTTLGTADSYEFFQILQSSLFATVDGFSFSGTGWDSLVANGFVANMFAGTAFALGTTVFERVSINQPDSDLGFGTTFISGLVSSGNINAGGSGVIALGNFQGAGTILSGIGLDDERWAYQGNNELRDTRRDAVTSTYNNATLTPIAALDTPVKILATWTEGRVSGYTTDATGTVTSSQSRDSVEPITISVSGRMDTQNDKDCTFYLAKGVAPLTSGDIIQESGVQVSLHKDKTFSCTIVWQDIVGVGESLELWGEQNEGPIDDMRAVSSVIRIN